jgi:Asp-tRNA(Asn)/Glu-tRNA(Gln) amidotransferase A subunit family amidase
MIARLPWWLKSLISWLLRLIGQQTAANVLSAFQEKSADELWRLQAKREQMREEFDRYFCENFDILLAPVNAHPAVPHGSFKDISHAASYTMLFNIMDYSVGVLPVTKVDREKDRIATRHGFWETLRSRQCLLQWISDRWFDADLTAGMPVGIQVTAGRLSEEKTLVAMKFISTTIHK